MGAQSLLQRVRFFALESGPALHFFGVIEMLLQFEHTVRELGQGMLQGSARQSHDDAERNRTIGGR
jgi:hypothetical protein